jgi:hypothetical protein
MPFPIKVCAICSEEFELRPDKPGFANRCPECSVSDEADAGNQLHKDVFEGKAASEVNAARRQAIREMLYQKDN